MAVNVTIIGADVLGQSIGLALKGSEAPMTVTLHDRDHERAQQGVSIGAGDRAVWNLPAAVKDADLVFVNETLNHIEKTLEVLGRELREGAVVTDTASIKQPVLRWATEYLPEGIHFVGSTPLGAPRTPTADAFREKRYAILPLPASAEAAVKLVTDTITLMGAAPLFIEPEEHDALLAAVQQLPILTSVSLLQVVTQTQGWKETAAMAGPLYAAATHLPSDDPDALAALLYYNRRALLRWLGSLQQELSTLQQILSRETEPKALADRLDRLIVMRQEWEEKQRVGDSIDYGETMEEAKTERGIGRLFGFGRRRRE